MPKTCVSALCFLLCSSVATAQEATPERNDPFEGLVITNDLEKDYASVLRLIEACNAENEARVVRLARTMLHLDAGFYGGISAIGQKDENGMTLLMHAYRSSQCRDLHTVLLGSWIKQTQTDNNGMSAMHHAAYNQAHSRIVPEHDPAYDRPSEVSMGVFRDFIARGDNLNTADASGTDVLMHLMKANGRLPSVRYVIDAMSAVSDPEAHPDLSRRDVDGNSALSYAAMNANDPRLWTFFAERGADLSETYTGDGLTLLHLAARDNEPAVVVELLRQGFDVNTPDSLGTPPLIWAVLQNADSQVARRLLENGADPRATNTNGATVTHAAALGGRDASVFALILDAGAPVDERVESKSRSTPGATPARLYAKYGRDPAVWALLSERGADLKRKSEAETPLLMEALTAKKSVTFVRAMLDAGCDVNDGFEPFKTTPLGMACRGSSPEMVDLLLDRGADPTVLSIENNNAFDYAEMNEQFRDHPVLERLRALAER
ncbi:MAG: ankyrin repeat domain-containing protein [Planctomycetota bacterium]